MRCHKERKEMAKSVNFKYLCFKSLSSEVEYELHFVESYHFSLSMSEEEQMDKNLKIGKN